jgi:hypothetical protein
MGAGASRECRRASSGRAPPTERPIRRTCSWPSGWAVRAGPWLGPACRRSRGGFSRSGAPASAPGSAVGRRLKTRSRARPG